MSMIENVSDTALWVAVYRAMETARPDALFKDPYAERLAGDRGRAIVDNMKRARAASWAMITRTAVFDEMILDRIANGGVDTVMNLAAGLDTRAWRMSLPPTLQWFDVDLPAMTEYKASRMRGERPVCRYEAIAADLTDVAVRDEVFRRIGGLAGTLLVITEGLLIYLGEENATALARALHAMPSARWWISDIANPLLIEMVQKSWGKELQKGNAPFKFAPEDSAAFFAGVGWKELSFRAAVVEAKRLGRQMPLAWLWQAMSVFLPRARRERMGRMSGFILLERT